ncbi:MAG: 5'-nucleotidase C-terminal domain-containing protein [bacterium]|nr:5'-nucleotidase C-terminal domain-containing protein [bacterium]
MTGPQDLALTYRSTVDGSDQPYRLYLPSAYDGKRRVPLFIAMHGTGGDQNKYFDHPDYGDGAYKREAEKRGIAIVCPHGFGTTEYRGMGENDVLRVIEEVCGKFLIDRDRIVCSGQSMGGTGTTYFCTRYPDLFAAGVPLASTYSHVILTENLRHVPMLYVNGGEDWPPYAATGPTPITERAKELGYDHVSLWMIPGVGHNTMDVSTERVLDWALEQRRVPHPKRVTHRAYFPIHGRAYWTEISAIRSIGTTGRIDATIGEGNTIQVDVQNVDEFILRPAPELLDLDIAIRIEVNGTFTFDGRCGKLQQVRFEAEGDGWNAQVEPRKLRPYTAYRTHKIGKVVKAPTTENVAGTTTLGNWMTDAMRDATGADIAIATHRHYRGVPMQDGQDVYTIELFNWLRPFNQALARFQMDGKTLLEILEDNIRENEPGAEQFLVQVSGCRYAFDRSKPRGSRIVETDIEPGREYTIVCYSSLLTRGDVLHLAGRYGKISFEHLEETNLALAWRAIDKAGGILQANEEQRVREIGKEGE